MKRLSLLMAVATFLLVLLPSLSVATTYASSSDKPLVVVTISPLYLIAREVIGDKAEIHVLAPAGVDPHHYSPAPRDRVLVESCTLFICTGKEEFLGALPQPAKRLSWDDWIGEIHMKDDNPHYLWLYPDNAKVLARKIAEALSELDPSNSDYYENRACEFCEKLEGLKLWLRDLDRVVRGLEGKGLEGRKVVLAADHFEPLAEWLGLNITYVIIRGEGLPGPRDIRIAIEKAKESALIIVSATQSEGDEGRIARQVAEASGIRMVHLYGVPMSMDDDYISFIKRNVIIIVAHLVEHQLLAHSNPLNIDLLIVLTIALAAVVVVETVIILRRLRT